MWTKALEQLGQFGDIRQATNRCQQAGRPQGFIGGHTQCAAERLALMATFKPTVAGLVDYIVGTVEHALSGGVMADFPAGKA